MRQGSCLLTIGFSQFCMGVGLVVAESRNHVRQQLAHFFNDLYVYCTGINSAVDHAVEHVFDRPGQLANFIGTNHAATAFEGVEGAAEFGEGFIVLKVLRPAREIFRDGFGNFCGLFDKDFNDLVIDIVVIALNYRCI